MTERGCWLADALIQAGMTAGSLGQQCDPPVDKSYVYKIIRGEKRPGSETLRRMVIVLEAHGVSVDFHEVLGVRR